MPKLTGGIGLGQHDAAGAQTSYATTVEVRSQLGGKVTENGQDNVSGVPLDVVCRKVRMHRRNRQPALRRKPLSLLKPDS
jgi:hypothetical protein